MPMVEDMIEDYYRNFLRIEAYIELTHANSIIRRLEFLNQERRRYADMMEQSMRVLYEEKKSSWSTRMVVKGCGELGKS